MGFKNWTEETKRQSRTTCRLGAGIADVGTSLKRTQGTIVDSTMSTPCSMPIVTLSHFSLFVSQIKKRPAVHQCSDCDKRFSDAEGLWQHRVSKHSADPNIRPMGPLTTETPEAEDLTSDDTHWVPCDVCGQAVPSHWQMGQHLETLKPLVGMKAVCMICNKVSAKRHAGRITLIRRAMPC